MRKEPVFRRSSVDAFVERQNRFGRRDDFNRRIIRPRRNPKRLADASKRRFIVRSQDGAHPVVKPGSNDSYLFFIRVVPSVAKSSIGAIRNYAHIGRMFETKNPERVSFLQG